MNAALAGLTGTNEPALNYLNCLVNLLLLAPEQFVTTNSARANERQTKHIQTILKAVSGDEITVGRLGGELGTGRLHMDASGVAIHDIHWTHASPPPLPLTLVLAMPRPQMLKRIMQTVAAMGVSRLCLVQTRKVEKSFWQSPSATDEAIRQHLLLGLEQGVATHLPQVSKHMRLRPFIEDTLPALAANTTRLIAHPGTANTCRMLDGSAQATLAVGPEGGFIEHEVDMFIDSGFKAIHLGSRILKVETAVPVLLSRLFPVQ